MEGLRFYLTNGTQLLSPYVYRGQGGGDHIGTSVIGKQTPGLSYWSPYEIYKLYEVAKKTKDKEALGNLLEMFPDLSELPRTKFGKAHSGSLSADKRISGNATDLVDTASAIRNTAFKTGYGVTRRKEWADDTGRKRSEIVSPVLLRVKVTNPLKDGSKQRDWASEIVAESVEPIEEIDYNAFEEEIRNNERLRNIVNGANMFKADKSYMATKDDEELLGELFNKHLKVDPNNIVSDEVMKCIKDDLSKECYISPNIIAGVNQWAY